MRQGRARPGRVGVGVPVGQISVVYPSDPMVITRLEKAINGHSRHARVATYRTEAAGAIPGHEQARLELQYRQFRRHAPQAVARLFTGGT